MEFADHMRSCYDSPMFHLSFELVLCIDLTLESRLIIVAKNEGSLVAPVCDRPGDL